jgi:hypothetical protein
MITLKGYDPSVLRGDPIFLAESLGEKEKGERGDERL